MADKDDCTEAPTEQTNPSEPVRRKYEKPEITVVVLEPLSVPGACGLERESEE